AWRRGRGTEPHAVGVIAGAAVLCRTPLVGASAHARSKVRGASGGAAASLARELRNTPGLETGLPLHAAARGTGLRAHHACDHEGGRSHEHADHTKRFHDGGSRIAFLADPVSDPSEAP